MDVEGTMQFILEQQASFAADIQQIKEVIKAQQDQLGQLGSALLDIATGQAKTNEIVAVLAERQVETEQNLKSLMSIVERHIAGHS
jgi:hypothetical protein